MSKLYIPKVLIHWLIMQKLVININNEHPGAPQFHTHSPIQ